MKLSQRIGFIGCGNMGSAILKGLLQNRIARANQILVYDAILSKAKLFAKKYKVAVAKENCDLVRRSNILLLAMKPQDLAVVAKEIKSALRSGQIVVSILAGTPIAKLKRCLGNRVVIIRAMPNLGASVGESITAVTSSSRLGLRVGETIFSGCGQVVDLSEKHFDLVTAVSGSGPAYFFLMMELLEKIAQKNGIPESIARMLAVQTALGAGRLAQTSNESPEVLRKRVTSKKGTTEAALNHLFKKRFPKIFAEAIHRAIRRAKELTKA